MPGYLVDAYIAALPKLQAEEMLSLVSAVSAGSGAAGKAGKDIIRKWRRAMNAGRERAHTPKYGNKEELEAAMAARGIKVEWRKP